METGRAIRGWILLDRGLTYTHSVQSPDDQLILPRLQHHPLITPEHPTRWRQGRGKSCCMPLLAAIAADLDETNPSCSGKGEALHQLGETMESFAMSRDIDPRHGFDERLVRPSL